MNLKMKIAIFLVLALAPIGLVFLGGRFSRTGEMIVALSACLVVILWTRYVLHTTYTTLQSSVESLGSVVGDA